MGLTTASPSGASALADIAVVCRAFRMDVAHNLGSVDPITSVPLAARVCYQEAGLPFSFQVDALSDILDYKERFTGALLSALCGFLWFVKVRGRQLSKERACVAHAHAYDLHRSCVRFAGDD